MHKTRQFAELFYPHDWRLLNVDLFTFFLYKFVDDIESVLFSDVEKRGLPIDILVVET